MSALSRARRSKSLPSGAPKLTSLPGPSPVFAAAHRAIDDVVARERETGRVEPAHHAVVVPGGLGAQFDHAVTRGPLCEGVEQLATDPLALRIAAHADRLEVQVAFAAAELALHLARLDEADQALVVGGGELRVRRRIAHRGGHPALEIGASGVTLDRGIERHHGVEIVAGQRTDRNACGGRFHGAFLGVSVWARPQPAA
jgi:hypothetical protein